MQHLASWSGGDAVTLLCEKNRQGLASILVAQCSGCGKEFPISTSKYTACQMVMFEDIRIITSFLCVQIDLEDANYHFSLERGV